MDCEIAREAVSAMLDGEDPGADPAEVEEHLAECADCREWREAAHEVTRRVRLVAASPAPRRAREAAAAVRARSRRRWRVRPAALCRLGLVVVAAVQLAITVPFLLLGSDRSAPVHVAHELGSFDAALAIGFLAAAWRPGRALGMRALVGAAAGLLVTTAVIDLASGRTTLPDELPHLLAVAGWLMIRRLAALTPPAVAESRPGLARELRARLRASAWRGERLPVPPSAWPAALAPGADRPAAAAAVWLDDLREVGRLRDSRDGHCDCPGCVAPLRAAGG